MSDEYTEKDGKVYNSNGEVAVLVSPNYGAGWYSWNTEKPECLFTPAIVRAVLSGELERLSRERGNGLDTMGDRFCKTIMGEDFCVLGCRDLQVRWLEPGTAFRIDEYDGFESIEEIGSIDYVVA